ncbi:hypothetical protein V6N13_060246 [Hibiscus sabdariffa]
MCAEKDHIKCLNRETEICGDKIIEAELMGGVSKDQKLTAFHGNGDEESNKKVCTLGHDEKVMVGNSVGIQRVIFVEKVCQEITKADGSDNGPIGVSSNRSGPESKIGVGFEDKNQEFKSSWANMLDETLNFGKGFNLSDLGKALSDGENEKDFLAKLEARKGTKRGKETKKKIGSLLELQNKSIYGLLGPGREVQQWVVLVIEIYDWIESCCLSQVLLVISWLIENNMAWWLTLISVYIGGFGDEEFAARAYDLVAVKVWDESAVLNFSMHNHE